MASREVTMLEVKGKTGRRCRTTKEDGAGRKTVPDNQYGGRRCREDGKTGKTVPDNQYVPRKTVPGRRCRTTKKTVPDNQYETGTTRMRQRLPDG